MASLRLPVMVRRPVLTQGRMAVQTQPSATASSGVALAVQPVIRALGNGGSAQANYTGQVTITKAGAPALSGTATVSAVAGVATFSGLTLTGSGTATLTASAAGRTSITTITITVA